MLEVSDVARRQSGAISLGRRCNQAVHFFQRPLNLPALDKYPSILARRFQINLQYLPSKGRLILN